MRVVSGLALKLGLQLALAAILLPWLFGIAVATALEAGLILWAVSFVIGDLAILPVGGSLIAAVADGAVAVLLFMFFPGLAFGPNLLWVGVAVLAGEWLVHHAFLAQHVVARRMPG